MIFTVFFIMRHNGLKLLIAAVGCAAGAMVVVGEG